MWFKKKHYLPFQYPDQQPIEVGDALLWGPGGFYPGKVVGFVRDRHTPADYADALQVDEGLATLRLLPATNFNADDVRLIERRTRDHRLAGLNFLAERIAQDNPHSMYVLGCLLVAGHTVPRRDPSKASVLLDRASQLGHPMAKVELALLCAGGEIDGRPDLLRAITLMKEADALKIPSARQWLAQLGM